MKQYRVLNYKSPGHFVNPGWYRGETLLGRDLEAILNDFAAEWFTPISITDTRIVCEQRIPMSQGMS